MKFHGAIGFSSTVETSPGVWTNQIKERCYYGDVMRHMVRRDEKDKVNDDINISNEFSIVADPYAYENFSGMIYIVFMGVKWKITDVTVDMPRLTISVGGVYNG